MIEVDGKLFRIDAIEAVVPIGRGDGGALIMLRSGASVTVRVPYANVKAALDA